MQNRNHPLSLNSNQENESDFNDLDENQENQNFSNLKTKLETKPPQKIASRPHPEVFQQNTSNSESEEKIYEEEEFHDDEESDLEEPKISRERLRGKRDEEEEIDEGGSSWPSFFTLKNIFGVIVLGGLLFLAFSISQNFSGGQYSLNNYLNGDVNIEDPIYDVPNEVETVSGVINLDETQVFALINQNVEQNRVDIVDLQEGKMVLYKNVSNSQTPLWIMLDVSKSVDAEGNESYTLSNVGTGRYKLPADWSSWVAERIFGGISTINDTVNNEDNFFMSFVNKQELSTILNPENVSFEDDMLVVQANSTQFELTPSEVVDIFQTYFTE